MTLQHQADLSKRNTLGVPSWAEHLIDIEQDDQIPGWVGWAQQNELNIRVLGGGSNLLLDNRVDGLVLAMRTQGRQVLGQDDQGRTLWRLAAGENWHEVVRASVEAGLSGLENLALIPGSVGAAPIQNIGAYGVEVGDRLHDVEAYDCRTHQWVRLPAAQCEFGYRDSLFKRWENRYIITAVTLALSTDFQPQLSYGPLQALAHNPNLSASLVMETVIRLRQSKLPSPDVIPNAGSFFKNPQIDDAQFQRLKADWPELVAYPSDDEWKLAAGWLIDQCGLKGQASDAGVGCYREQALVLINPKRAEFLDVVTWQRLVQKAVANRFGIVLEREPRYWGSKGSGQFE
ncbi:UDP-N-acetylmuramate dehydrogenase [Saccharospirillum mangrovi]|uniref:UDP-N-acetylmuramate dehydrogenase n=1 Tax=Saccharospirillum mangrovi TaxID=2161747 RepID=UPI000D361331|nr:UDP-N-acetylmuramate dehydrogenase [Saccharospirillum mangrovi]